MNAPRKYSKAWFAQDFLLSNSARLWLRNVRGISVSHGGLSAAIERGELQCIKLVTLNTSGEDTGRSSFALPLSELEKWEPDSSRRPGPSVEAAQ
jgi:hypothetical protein